MIKYRLVCAEGHEFEAWFRDSADYDQQEKAALVSCPECGTMEVRKAIMAPAIARSSGMSVNEKFEKFQQNARKAAAAARSHIEKNYDYVGDRFPEEARRIHYGECEPRQVYGEATGKEVRELVDEGVAVAPVPAEAAPKKPEPKKIN